MRQLFRLKNRKEGLVQAYNCTGQVVEYDSLHIAIIESRKK